MEVTSLIERPTAVGLDRFLQDFRLREIDEIQVDAPAERTYSAAREFDLSRQLPGRVLFWLRAVPQRLLGKGERARLNATLDDITAPGTGFVLLKETLGKEFTVGSIGKFWKPQIDFLPFRPAEFAAIDEPGYGKLVWSMAVRPEGPKRSVLSLELRVTASDDAAWTRFLRYWRIIGRFSRFIRRSALARIQRAAEAREPTELPRTRRSRLDADLPRFDFDDAYAIRVDAPAESAWAALWREDFLRLRIVRTLFWLREFPERALRRWRGQEATPAQVTLGDLLRTRSFVVLDDEPGRAVILGAVGKPWKRDYGGHPVDASDFASFDEPGFAKIAWSFAVEPLSADRSLLTLEWRTRLTDAAALRAFRRYWRLAGPAVRLMARLWARQFKVEMDARQV